MRCLCHSRAKQIEQFETFNPTAKGNPQKTIYNVPVPTAFGQLVFQVYDHHCSCNINEMINVELFVHSNLETGFPERAPQLRVLQRVMHPWVDRVCAASHFFLCHHYMLNDGGMMYG